MVIGITLPEAQELVESLPRQRRLRFGELELPTALYLTAHEEFSFLHGSLSGSLVAVALTSLPFGMERLSSSSMIFRRAASPKS